MSKKIYIVGMGPGAEEKMTGEAIMALEEADIIIGYNVYLELLGERFANKEKLSTPMKREVERCRLCLDKAREGLTVALICSGDAGVYGMASLMYEISQDEAEVELVVIPGVTAAVSGAALLGAPINHDFCVISLSDLLTPWDKIVTRIKAAAEGDFCIVIYNPSSIKRRDYMQKICDILLERIEPDRPCGYVENIGREGTKVTITTLKELRSVSLNMFTTVFIGNSDTIVINDKMIAKRGYKIE